MFDGCSIALSKSPFLLFFCIAKVCILDKSPISDQGTHCSSRKQEDRVCSCSPPSFSPSQHVSWLLALDFTCCHEQQPLPSLRSRVIPQAGTPQRPTSGLQMSTENHQILLPTFGNPNLLPCWLLPYKPLGCSTLHQGWMEPKAWGRWKPAQHAPAQLSDAQPSQPALSICMYR